MSDASPPPPDPYDEANDPFGTGDTWEYALDYWPTEIRNAAALAAALALSRAMIAWRDGGPPAPLDIIKEALNASNAELCRTAVGTLPRVIHAREHPYDTLISLWESVRAPARAAMAWRASMICQNLTESEQLDFRTRGLRDKSKWVRSHAASNAGRSGFAPILPVLKEAIAAEPDESVRIDLAAAHDLIDHGYYVFEHDEDSDHISLLLLSHDCFGGGKCIVSVSRAEVNRIGLEAAIAREQEEIDERARDFDRFVESWSEGDEAPD